MSHGSEAYPHDHEMWAEIFPDTGEASLLEYQARFPEGRIEDIHYAVLDKELTAALAAGDEAEAIAIQHEMDDLDSSFIQ